MSLKPNTTSQSNLSADSDSSTVSHPRYHLLDTIRGLLILGVVLFHLILDLSNFGIGNIDYFLPSNTLWIRIVQIAGIVLFIFISGICSRLSRNNLKRGLIALGCALIITLVTYLITPEFFIFMGILHLLSLCMILSHFINLVLLRREKLNDGSAHKVHRVWTLTACFVFLVLFALTFNIYDANYGIGFLNIHIPLNGFGLYGTFPGYILGLGGFHGFSSADYFPLIPWLFAFIAGMCVGGHFKRKDVPKLFTRDFAPPLTFIGRHSLIVYMAHQPVIYGICALIEMFN